MGKSKIAMKKATPQGGDIRRSTSSSSLYIDALDAGYEAFDKLACEEISEATLMRRKRKLARELSALSLLTTHEWKLEELQGRISGSKEWRQARGELGSNPTEDEDKQQQKSTTRRSKNQVVDKNSPSHMLPCSASSSVPNELMDTIEVPCEDNCRPPVKINVSSFISSDMNKEIFSVWLGGQNHPDTITFTQAACLLPPKSLGSAADSKERFKQIFTRIFAKCKSDGMENSMATAHALKQAQIEIIALSQPKLVGIKVYASSNFVNGVDCVYYDTEQEGKQRSYGDHDDPTENILSLDTTESKIVKISIRYGNIIDGISLSTKDGKEHVYGGAGGEFEETLVIPAGYELNGFYGGIGGHLHHLGVILVKIE